MFDSKFLTKQTANYETRLVDTSCRTSIEKLAVEIEHHKGCLDILINNAGVGLGATFEEMKLEDFKWLMNINFWGVVYGCKIFLPLVRRAEHGHIINISSVFGMISLPTVSAYNASKFAVRGFTESLRQELEDSSVHVCCVHPGGIDTNIAVNSRGTAHGLSKEERAEEFKKVAKTSAESAATQILRAIEKKKKRLLIGKDAYFISILSRLFPVIYPRILGRLMPQIQEVKKSLRSRN